jgi:flagellar hook-associated protein 1 FlgK
MQNLDNMTMNFTDLVNEVHRKGYGINGITGTDFFTERPFVINASGNHDRDGDGVYDSTYLFRISGTNELNANDQIGLAGTMTFSGPKGNVEVPYFATDTVAEVIARINNSGAEVVARLNRDGFLSLKGTPSQDRENPDFVIRHVEDSGYFLTGYSGMLHIAGAYGAYDWGRADAAEFLAGDGNSYALAPTAHPSGWVDINPSILQDFQLVASGFGINGRPANAGNGEAAMAIAAIRNTQVMVGRLGTFDDYFADSVGRIGLLGEQSGRQLETQNQIMKQLKDMRESISGVNMDEELSAMIKYQHGYAAAARFITTVNSLLDTIINRMGVS